MTTSLGAEGPDLKTVVISSVVDSWPDMEPAPQRKPLGFVVYFWNFMKLWLSAIGPDFKAIVISSVFDSWSDMEAAPQHKPLGFVLISEM